MQIDDYGVRVNHTLVTVLALLTALSLALVAEPTASYERRLGEWRKARLAEAAGPEGWTTVVALALVAAGGHPGGERAGVEARLPQSAPPLVGTIQVDGKAVSFEAASASR